MSRLSGREQAVWDKRNDGLTFKQIAKDLGLCPATVSFAYRKAYRKIEYGKAMKINKLTEYEDLGSVEDIKSIHRANQSCEKILETSLMVSQNNRLLSQELEVYKRALENISKANFPYGDYEIARKQWLDCRLDQARKELEDERNND